MAKKQDAAPSSETSVADTVEQLEKELQSANKSLAESELRCRTLLDGSPVCNKIIDLDSRLRYMSSAGIEQLQIPDIAPFYGQVYPPGFYPKSMRAPLVEHLNRAMAEEPSSIECPVLDMQGNAVWYVTTFHRPLMIRVKSNTSSPHQRSQERGGTVTPFGGEIQKVIRTELGHNGVNRSGDGDLRLTQPKATPSSKNGKE